MTAVTASNSDPSHPLTVSELNELVAIKDRTISLQNQVLREALRTIEGMADRSNLLTDEEAEVTNLIHRCLGD